MCLTWVVFLSNFHLGYVFLGDFFTDSTKVPSNSHHLGEDFWNFSQALNKQIDLFITRNGGHMGSGIPSSENAQKIYTPKI